MKISIKMGVYEAILDMDFVKLESIYPNVKLDGKDILIEIMKFQSATESYAEATTGTVQGNRNVRKSHFIKQQKK